LRDTPEFRRVINLLESEVSHLWIVKVALDRPNRFIILALLILLLSPVIILRTPVDIFPNIDIIPVTAISWTYLGLNPEEFEGRVTMPYEKVLTTLVDNIQHVESTTYNGLNVVKIYLRPGIKSRDGERTSHGGTTIHHQATSAGGAAVSNHQLHCLECADPAAWVSGKGLNEQQLNDYRLNFIRPPLITVPGAGVPSPYGGKRRQIMVNLF
jgi:multidrug efflux pump subunit AcrB